MKKILLLGSTTLLLISQFACTSVDNTIVPDIASTVVGTFSGSYTISSIDTKTEIFDTTAYKISTLTGLKFSTSGTFTTSTVVGTSTMNVANSIAFSTTLLGTVPGVYYKATKVTTTISTIASQKLRLDKVANKQVNVVPIDYLNGTNFYLNLTGYQLAPIVTAVISTTGGNFSASSATYNPSSKILFYSVKKAADSNGLVVQEDYTGKKQ